MPTNFNYGRLSGHFKNAAVEFRTELLDFEEGVKREDLARAKQLARAAFDRIIELTPVDTEDTVKRWKVSLDTPSNDDSPSDSFYAEGLAVIKSAKFGQDIIISNSSVVAEIWEYGLFKPSDPGPSKHHPDPAKRGQVLVIGGYNVVAPQGMVSVTLAELETFLE